jgi:hypothetical protein
MRKRTTALQGMQETGRARRQRVRLLLTSGSGLRGGGGGVPLNGSTSFTSSPPSTSPAARAGSKLSIV